MQPAPKNRVRPLQALAALARVMRDPDDTRNGARFVLALQGRRNEIGFQRFRAHPQGARILAERRQLIDRLRDRAWLRSLDEGSLGRAYLDFVEREDLSADGLREAVERADAYYLALDAERRLVHDRIGDMHDLWHVLTGYGRDLIGENLLVFFTWKQLHTRAFRLIMPMTYLFNESRCPGFRALARDALRRGGDAVWLPVQDWETWLTLPLDEVREVSGVGSPPLYVPERSPGAPELAASAH